MIMAFAPANCFQPPKTILSSFRGADRTFKMGDFEFFREKAWQAKHALEFYMKNVKYRFVRYTSWRRIGQISTVQQVGL